MVRLHVAAVDAAGGVHHLPVDRKGFEGEELTISDPTALAYQTMGEIRGVEGWKSLPSEAVARIAPGR